MIYTTFYLRILRLSISNKKLLEIYASLLGMPGGTGGVLKKNDIITRKALRERIELELCECVNGSYFTNKKCPFSKASISCMLTVVKMDSFLQDLLSIHPSEWDKCYKWELDNIGQYYNLLYTENLPHDITNLLLGQKEKIENYLIGEL